MNSATRLSALRDVLQALNARGTRGALLALMAALILLPALTGGEPAIFALRYDRPAIAAGEWWRLISGQFVHMDPGHALANAAGAVLVWALVGGMHRAMGWVLMATAALLATAAGLWWGSPEVLWYVGASGWLHGLLAAGALPLAMAPGDRLGRVVLLVLAAKLTWEQLVGPLSGSGSVPVVVDAHAYGAAGGLLCALLAGRRSAPPPPAAMPGGPQV
jgi:rhomboid family GlyGly-CTERM serine protease